MHRFIHRHNHQDKIVCIRSFVRTQTLDSRLRGNDRGGKDKIVCIRSFVRTQTLDSRLRGNDQIKLYVFA